MVHVATSGSMCKKRAWVKRDTCKRDVDGMDGTRMKNAIRRVTWAMLRPRAWRVGPGRAPKPGPGPGDDTSTEEEDEGPIPSFVGAEKPDPTPVANPQSFFSDEEEDEEDGSENDSANGSDDGIVAVADESVDSSGLIGCPTLRPPVQPPAPPPPAQPSCATELYTLDASLQEREAEVLAQRASCECPNGKYAEAPLGHTMAEATLSQKAQACGDAVFGKYGRFEDLPARPYGSGRRGFYVKNQDVLGIRGIAGQDLSVIWHMLMVPTFARAKVAEANAEAGANLADIAASKLVRTRSTASEGATSRRTRSLSLGMARGARRRASSMSAAAPAQAQAKKSSGIELQWVFDITAEHVPLLLEMRRQGLAFVEHNRAYFLAMYAGQTLAGKPVEYWLKPENVQFGFHMRPTVGYLHCHMCVGPVTEFGYSSHYQFGWLSLDRVIRLVTMSPSENKVVHEKPTALTLAAI